MILDGRSDDAIAAAVRALKAGELVGLPTETVYGLAGDAGNDQAVARIFETKGRPADHPLIVHVADAASVDHFAADVPDFARRLIDAFWPGPLTLILPRRAGVGAAAAGGQDSIGLRCPSHPVAQQLLREFSKTGSGAVAAPSANKFGHVSPTTAQHVRDEFGPDLPVLDGGACEVGLESTIVDCTRSAPVLLRPGGVSRAQVEAASGQRLRARDELATPAPRASGTLLAHYAPSAPVRLMDAKALQTALDLLGADAARLALYARAPLKMRSSRVDYRRMPDDAAATAQQLFAVLRDFDAAGARLIWIETPPDTPDWEAVRDRLQRAAAA